MPRPKKPLGKVTHYYEQIGVAAVLLEGKLRQGEKVRIGRNNNFVEQEVTSMQLEHERIAAAKKGQEIGLKVGQKVREGDLLFKV